MSIKSGKIILNGRQYGGAQLYELTPPASQHHVAGDIISGHYDGIEGIGYIDITLNNGIATINFSIKFTHETEWSEDNFLWGICSEMISDLDVLPHLIPIDGGYWEFYTYNSTIMGWGPSLKAQYDNDLDLHYWTLGKYDGNVISDITLLASSQFHVGDVVHGICYATYNIEETDLGRIINGNLLTY